MDSPVGCSREQTPRVINLGEPAGGGFRRALKTRRPYDGRMGRWPAPLKTALYLACVALALWLFAAHPIPWRAYANVILAFGVLGFLALSLYGTYGPGAIRRREATWDKEFPAGDAHVKADGAFEWHPRGEPRTGIRHGLVHRWWDAERGARYDAHLAFDVPDDVAPDLLAKATKRALKAATRALPGRGKVRAKAAARDEPGPTSLVRVRLHVQGIGAERGWAREAAEAFAKSFLAALKRAGHLSDRR